MDNALDRIGRLDRIMERYRHNIHKAYMGSIERLQDKGDYREANRRLERLGARGYGRGNLPMPRRAYMSGNIG